MTTTEPAWASLPQPGELTPAFLGAALGTTGPSAPGGAVRRPLGVSAWQPRTDRQRRLIEVGIERAKAALACLRITHPDVLAG